MSQSPQGPDKELTDIFINYRRADTSGHAGRLEQELTRRFPGRVFMDIHTIEVGTDFADAINSEVGKCGALIVLIGNQWLDITDPKTGKRRLDNPNDFVAIEIAEALKRNTRVIPVLVEGAKMPEAEELPASLAGLVRRNAIEVSDTRWDYDVAQLIKVLEKICGGTTPLGGKTRTGTGDGTITGTGTGTSVKWGVAKIALPIAAALIAVVALVMYLSSGKGAKTQPQAGIAATPDNTAKPPAVTQPLTRSAVVTLSKNEVEFFFPFVTTGDNWNWYLKESLVDKDEYHWDVFIPGDYLVSVFLQKGQDDTPGAGDFKTLVGYTENGVMWSKPDVDFGDIDEEFPVTIEPLVEPGGLRIRVAGDGVKRMFANKQPKELTFRILTPKEAEIELATTVEYK